MAAGSIRPAAASAASRRPDDLVARAVVEGDDERHRGVVARQRLRMLDQAAQIGAEIVAAADDADPHAGGMEFAQILLDETLEQAEQERDLGRRAAPVLGGEAVERQDPDAEIAGIADRGAQRLEAAAMPLLPGQATHLRPAPIAVHDDRDMGGLGEVSRALAC